MLRVVLRGLMARKLRLALTSLAIALGVGFIAGTYVLTDTLNYAFTSLFTKTSNADVVVQSQSGFTADSYNQDRAPVPASLVVKVRSVPGVLAADGFVAGYAQLLGKDGKAVSTMSGAPTLGISATEVPELTTATVREGAPRPVGADQMGMDAYTAHKNNFHIGDKVTVLLQDGARDFTLVSIFGFGDVDSMAGATVSMFDLGTAQAAFSKQGSFDSIGVKAQPGISQEQLRGQVAAAVGPQYETITGQTNTDRTLDSVASGLSFFSTVLLIFAAISLFVGAFIIFNTFLILIAQRTRELGLLRALGATTRQVALSVIGEAFAVGLVSSAIGFGIGVLMAYGLSQLLAAAGMELPPAPLQIQARTVIVALVSGTVITVLAALSPALRTRRLSAMDALHTGLVRTGRRRVRAVVTGSAVTAAGILLLIWGLFGAVDNRLPLIGVGALAVFLGVAMLSPMITRPAAATIGWPVTRLAHLPGRLARENAMRSPSRTARTASALMIGLGLVSFVAIFGASLKASAGTMFDNVMRADYIISPPNQFSAFSPEVANRVRAIEGVSTVSQVRATQIEYSGAKEYAIGFEPETFTTVMNVKFVAGGVADMTAGTVAMSSQLAQNHGYTIGSTVPVTFEKTGTQQLRLAAIYDDSSGSINERFALPMETYASNVGSRLDVMVAIKLSGGADQAAVGKAINAALVDYPQLKIESQAQFRDSMMNQIDQLLTLIDALLALAILIALVGIVNTLALSVLERTSEIGLLRAVGMTRREVRRMIRWEAVIVALLGAILGTIVGLGFGLLTLHALADKGLGTISIPVGELVAYLVVAGVAGVLAAIMPARRAAKTDVLTAIGTT